LIHFVNLAVAMSIKTQMAQDDAFMNKRGSWGNIEEGKGTGGKGLPDDGL